MNDWNSGRDSTSKNLPTLCSAPFLQQCTFIRLAGDHPRRQHNRRNDCINRADRVAYPHEDYRPYPCRGSDGQPRMLRPLTEAICNYRVGVRPTSPEVYDLF